MTSSAPRIISSVNVNGVRAAVKKGLIGWLEQTSAEFVCLQETRADDEQLREALTPAASSGWVVSAAEPSTKGRNGVAVLSRTAPERVRIGYGDPEFATSGRYLEADFGKLTVASLYVPSGEVGTPRQEEKDRFLKSFGVYLFALGKKRREIVVCGDWNIAHTELDLKSWKTNKKSSGFLPHEREWFGQVLDHGSTWVDVTRTLHPGVDGPYTWWSYRGKAFDNDAGWRIDYQLANRSLAAKATTVRVERAAAYDQRWSDHAPVTVHYS